MLATDEQLDWCLHSHSGSQLHSDCRIDRTLTVAERMRLQSIPDGLPLKVRAAAMQTHEQDACMTPSLYMDTSMKREHGLRCRLLLQV